MKYILLLFLLSTLVIPVSSQTSWTVNPNDFQYSMTVTGNFLFYDSVNVDVNDNLYAFNESECRGIAHPVYDSDLNDWIVYLIIYSNTENEILKFKYVNQETAGVLDVFNFLKFQINKNIGSLDSLYAFSLTDQTGIEYIKLFSLLNIYPNPASDKINIDIRELGENICFVLYDINGNKLLEKLLYGGGYYEIPIVSYSAGIYFYKIFYDKKLISNNKIIFIK